MFNRGLLGICGTEGSELLLNSIVESLNNHVTKRRNVIKNRIESTHHTISELWESRLMGNDEALISGQKPLRIEYLRELEYIAGLCDAEKKKKSKFPFISPMNLKKINFKSTEFKYVLNETAKGKDMYIIISPNEQSSLYPFHPAMLNELLSTFYTDDILNALGNAKDENEKKTILLKHIPRIRRLLHAIYMEERSVPYNVIQILVLVDALHKAKCRRISLIGMMPFGRQDEAVDREGITFPLFLNLMTMAGVSNFLTFDQHCPKNISSNMHFESLPAFPIIMKKMKLDFPALFLPESLKFASVDAGGSKRVEKYAKKEGYKMVLAHKSRSEANTVDSLRIIGNVEGYNLLFIDDMIDTGGSLQKACEAARSYGAKDIIIAVTYGIFSEPALERLDELYKKGIIKAVYCSNLIPRCKVFKAKHQWYREVSVSGAIALGIYRTNTGRSIEKLFDDKVKTLLDN